MCNTIHILKYPFKYRTTYKFNSLGAFSKAVCGEVALLYGIEVEPTADNSTAASVTSSVTA
jgi:hypothetical protein